jgi:hypothetical protein
MWWRLTNACAKARHATLAPTRGRCSRDIGSKPLPPLTDGIAFALARAIDDAQLDFKRDPTHSDLDFLAGKCKLTHCDPKSSGSPVGKAKRVRHILTSAVENHPEEGARFVEQLVVFIRTAGGFRADSPNFIGEGAFTNLRDAFKSEGFELASDGELRPAILDGLEGMALTEALHAYVRRAQKGVEDAALLTGTSKDLLEATAAHVLKEKWPTTSVPHHFPSLLGMAFTAVGLKTPETPTVQGEPPQHRLQRGLYEAACAINTLRNKQGSGHGRPWVATVTPEDARSAVQIMGTVAELLLRTLEVSK